jgi:hypothetical protein
MSYRSRLLSLFGCFREERGRNIAVRFCYDLEGMYEHRNPPDTANANIRVHIQT